MPEIALPDVLAFLKEKYPAGATFAGEILTAVPEGPRKVRVNTLDHLSEIALAQSTVEVALKDVVVELEVRGMSAEEVDVMDKALPDVMPPRKLDPNGKKGETIADFESQVYKDAVDRHYLLKRTYIIDKGLIGMTIPGNSLEEKCAFLQQKFPPRVIEKLVVEIRKRTSSDFERASF